MAELTVRLEGVPQEKADRIAKLLELLIEKSDVVENLVRLVESLERLGLADVVSAVEENRDFAFNAIARKEVASLLGNAMVLMYMLSKVNQETLYEVAESAPRCIEDGYRELRNSPEKGMGLLEALRIIRSPEIAALLRALHRMLRCIRGK